MTSSPLKELADKVEAASGPDRELECRIWAAQKGGGFDTYRAVVPDFGQWQAPAYTASIDAAMTLVPEGWNWMAGNRDQPKARAYVNNGQPHFVSAQRPNPKLRWFEVVAVTPALALTAAALRARAALSSQEGSEA